MKELLFSGVCTALITPFSENGVDFETLEKLLEHQIANGIKAVCVCGTTGEASTMSDAEKMEVISFVVRYCENKMKVIAGTGSNNTAHAVELSKQADALGVDGVLVVTPYYNKATPDGLLKHFEAVADAVTCPVIVYNVPGRTGVDIPLSVYEELSLHPKIVGVKEASGNCMKAAKIINRCGKKLTVWCGNDDEIVQQSVMGAKGVISVLSNICPKETAEICNLCLLGKYEHAAKIQLRYTDLIEALFCEVNPIPIKTAMNMAGFQVGLPRLPLCEMENSNREFLKTVLQKHGII